MQATGVPIVALLAGFAWGIPAAAAAAYGALVALGVSALLLWREAQSARHPGWDPRQLMGRFIRVSVERLVLLLGLLGLGFGVLQLAPLPLLLGLVSAQFAWLALALGQRTAGRRAT